MGLGRALLRDVRITQEDTHTGQVVHDVIVAPPNQMGAWADWQAAGPWRGGMTLPPAHRAALLIAGAAAGLPWHAYRPGADGTPRQVSPDPPLLARPAGREVRFDTLRALFLDVLWNGNGIWLKVDDDDFGQPRTVLPIPARQVWVKRIEEQDAITSIPVGTEGYFIAGRWYHPDRVIHFRGPHEPGASLGLGLVELFLSGTLQLATEHRKQAAAASGSGIPTGIIKSDNPDLTQGEASALKAAWKSSQATRDVQVLNATTSFEALAWNPTEAQLLDARKFDHVEIAQIFGVDPSWLGAAQSSRAYANVEQEGIMLVRFGGLADMLEMAGETLAAHLEPDVWVEPLRDKLLAADTLARYQAHQIGISSGFLAPSEVRAMERRPPFTPAQKAELEALKPEPPAPAAPADAKPGDKSDSSGRQGPPAAGESKNQSADRAERAKGRGDHDGSNLKAYWLHGEGLALWATTPKPWTALYTHLLKYLSEERAAETAASWYHEHFGRWPGGKRK